MDAPYEQVVADVTEPDADLGSASSSDAQSEEGVEVVEEGYVSEKPMLEGTKLFAAEQEITRQIAQANLQRVRAQYTDARKTLRPPGAARRTAAAADRPRTRRARRRR